MGGDQLFELLSVKLLYVFNLDEGFISLSDMFLDLSKQDLNLTYLGPLQEVHSQLITGVWLVRVHKLLKDLVVAFFVYSNVCVVNLVGIFAHRHFSHNFDLLDNLSHSWVVDFSLTLFVCRINGWVTGSLHGV